MSDLNSLLYARNFRVDGISDDDVQRLAQGLGTRSASALRQMRHDQLVVLLARTFRNELEGELNEIATKLQAILQRDAIASTTRRGGNRLRRL